MAKHFNRLTVATPGNLQAALAAGGNLTPGVTYYYRIIAVRSHPSAADKRAVCLSQASAEVSATPDASNKSIALTWDAVPDAHSYILQRAAAPESYPLGGANTLKINAGPYGSEIWSTTLLTLTDDGGAGGKIYFTQGNLDHSREVPVIEVYSDAGDTITMSDIYDAVAGWGDADIIGPPSLKTDALSAWRSQCPYVVLGSLYIRNCTFQLKSPLYLIGGAFYVDYSVLLQVGDLSLNYVPQVYPFNANKICYSNDNSTYGGYWVFKTRFSGQSGSFCRNLIQRALNPYAKVGGYSAQQWSDGFDTNIKLYSCIAGYGTENSMFVHNPNIDEIDDCIFESIHCKSLKNCAVRFAGEGLSLRSHNNCTAENVKVYKATIDLAGGHTYGQKAVDCLWQSQGQTDNQPFCYWAVSSSYTGRALILCHRVAIRVSDSQDNPIEGALIALTDALGNSEIFQDSGATFTSSLNDADDVSPLNVSDGTKFSIGDVIKCENYSELLLITGIAANTLTVQRGYGGTAKRATGTGNNNRVLRQLASLTTDAQGKAVMPEPVINRELKTTGIGSGYWVTNKWEDELVSGGYAERNYRTPHTLTIEKAGYQIYQDVIEINRKLELEVGLSPYVPVNPVDVEISRDARLEVALETAPNIEVELN